MASAADAASPAPESTRSLTQTPEAVLSLSTTGLAPLLLPTPPPSSSNARDRATFSRRCRRVATDQRGPFLFDSKEIYATCQLLSMCSMEFLKDLQRLGGEEGRQGKVFEPGAIVVEQGSLGFSLFILNRGELEALETSSLSTAKKYKIYGQADSFGENQLLGLEPRHDQTVRAKTMCHVFEISCRVFMQALVQHPAERRLFEREVVTRYEALRTQRRKPRRKKVTVRNPSTSSASVAGFARQPSNQGTTFPSVALVAVAATSAAKVLPGSSVVAPIPEHSFSGTTSPVSQSSKKRGTGKIDDPPTPNDKTNPPDEAELELPDLAIGTASMELGHVSPPPPARGTKAASFRGTLHRMAATVQQTTKGGDDSQDVGERPSEEEEGMLIPVWWRDRRPLRTSLLQDEEFVGVVKRSLKEDAKHGYKVPSQHAKAVAGMQESEDCRGEVPLDLGLLPPLASMSSVQKQNIERQLDARVVSRRKFQCAAKNAMNLTKMAKIMPRRVSS